MKRLLSILIILECVSVVSAQTYHSFIAEAEIGYAGPLYGVTAAVRPGYELKQNHFLLHLTIGAGYTYCRTPMPDYDESVPATDTEQYQLLEHSYYTHRMDTRQWMEIQASFMLGGEWERFYFLAGVIPAYSLNGRNTIDATVRVEGDYGMFIDPYTDMPNHGFTTRPYHQETALRPFGTINAALEIGVPLGEHLRLGLYGHYPALSQATPPTWSAGIKLTAVVSWKHKKHYPCRCIFD